MKLTQKIQWIFLLILLFVTVVSQQAVLREHSFNLRALMGLFSGGGGYLFIHLTLLCFLAYALYLPSLEKWVPHRHKIFISFFFLSFLIFLSLAHSKLPIFQFVIFVSWFVVSVLGIQWALNRYFQILFPIYLCGSGLFVFVELTLFILGAFGAAIPAVHFLLFFVPIPFFIAAFVRKEVPGWKSLGNYFQNLEAADWIWLQGFFILLCLSILSVVVPEVVGDAAQLHIPKAMRIGYSHGIRGILDFPYQAFDFFPSFVHVIFSFGLVISGEVGYKTITVLFAIILVLALLDFSKRTDVKLTYAMAGIVLFLFVPAFIWHIGVGYLDLITSSLGIVAIVSFFHALSISKEGSSNDRRLRSCLILASGILFGATINAKYNMALLLVCFGAILIVAIIFKVKAVKDLSFREILIGVFGVALISIPHWIAMFIFTDNPIYPIANSFFLSPYWSQQAAVKQLFFHDFSWKEMLLFPYTLTRHTSWFGENVDGSMGIWFFLFFPFLFFKKVSHPFLGLVLLIVFVYMLSLHFLESNYLRYYIPVFGLLAIVMAKNLELFVGKIGAEPTSRNLFCKTAIPYVILLITMAQLKLLSVWSPTSVLWEQYRNNNPAGWYELHRPGYSKYLSFIRSLPDQTYILHDGVFFVSGSKEMISMQTDVANMPGYSGLYKKYPSELRPMRNSVALWLQDNILGYVPKNGFSNLTLEKSTGSWFEAMIQAYSDIYVLGNLYSYIPRYKEKNLIRADRLIYSSSIFRGIQSQFYAAFRVNDKLLGKPAGVYWSYDEKGLSKQNKDRDGIVWYQIKRTGERATVHNLRGVEIENKNYLRGEMLIPDGSKVFKIIANIEYLGLPDQSVGLSINYKDENNKIIKETIPGVFSGTMLAVYCVIDKIPEEAKSMAIIISPTVSRKVRIPSYSLFFEKG